MKLYLSSYRLGNQSKELIKWMEKQGNKILVIPNAVDAFPDGERKTRGILDKIKDLTELGFESEILDLREYFNKQNVLKNKLKSYKAFYAIGGNVFVLRKVMKLSGFDNYLKEIAPNPDYLYAGFSAGICVLAKNLKGIDLADEPEKDPYNAGDIIWEGVGLIDYMPVPHYHTPNHPESPLMNDVVKYLNANKLPYKTLKDGDVIIEEIKDPLYKSFSNKEITQH